MKCDKCTFLNADKTERPCSICLYRPHDLCCGNFFTPAEPVVLSAEEWVDRQPFRSIEDENGTVKLFRSKRLFTFDQMVHACETFNQNGRLERDLELRSLVYAVEKVRDAYGSEEIGLELAYLFQTFENLKPLNKD